MDFIAASFIAYLILLKLSGYPLQCPALSLVEMCVSAFSSAKIQLKTLIFISYLIIQSFKGHRCESGIAFFCVEGHLKLQSTVPY